MDAGQVHAGMTIDRLSNCFFFVSFVLFVDKKSYSFVFFRSFFVSPRPRPAEPGQGFVDNKSDTVS
jgi:hypothetical protein